TYRRHDVVNVADQIDWYRAGVPYQSRTWEVRGFTNAPAPPAPLTVDAPAYAFAVAAQAPAAAAIAYEAVFDPARFQRRQIADVQTFYRADDGQAELALGQVAARGLLARSRRMAFSQALLDATFDPGHSLPAGLAAASGYDFDGTQYWAR